MAGGDAIISSGADEEEEEEGGLSVADVRFVTCVCVEDTKLGPVSADPHGADSVCELAEFVVVLASLLSSWVLDMFDIVAIVPPLVIDNCNSYSIFIFL
jgi:hypothetical protein